MHSKAQKSAEATERPNPCTMLSIVVPSHHLDMHLLVWILISLWTVVSCHKFLQTPTNAYCGRRIAFPHRWGQPFWALTLVHQINIHPIYSWHTNPLTLLHSSFFGLWYLTLIRSFPNQGLDILRKKGKSVCSCKPAFLIILWNSLPQWDLLGQCLEGK